MITLLNYDEGQTTFLVNYDPICHLIGLVQKPKNSLNQQTITITEAEFELLIKSFRNVKPI